MKKLCFFVATIFFVGFVIACMSSCKNVSREFQKNFNAFAADNVISDAEYNSLKSTILKKPGFQVVVAGQALTMNDEASLQEYILKRGVSCSKIKPEKSVSFDKLAIYLENSASMAGYSNAGNPMFTAPILALFNGGEANTEIETAYVGEKQSKLMLTSVPRARFESELTNGKIATTEGSPLDQILTMMVDSVADNSVIGLVTDGIVSGSNREIVASADRAFTIKNLPLIEQRVRNSVKKAADRNVSMLIYRLESSYTGTYYDYKNGKHNVKSVTRPYYIILLGNVVNLKKMESSLAHEGKFTPTHKFASYSVEDYNTVSKGFLSLAPAANVDVVVVPNTGTIDFREEVPSIPVNFRLQVALNNIPSYYQDEDIIKNALEVYYVDSNTEVLKNEFIQSVEKDETKVNVYHITLQMDSNFVQKLPSDGMKLYVRMKGGVDRWDEPLSSSEDTQFRMLPDSYTFALTTLMDGICNGFGFNKGVKDVMNIELNIKK